jgi:dienelactone hydrolase
MSRGAVLIAVAMALAGCASQPPASEPTAAVQAAAVPPIPIEVMKPEGEGPFPAVVVMHDCSGLGPRSSGSPKRWAKVLVEQGYVVLIPDSFSTRGHAGGVCTNPSPSRNEVSPWRRASDAYAALAHARTLAYVDGRRVAVMGGSHGGATTLATIADVAARSAGPRFVAAIAIYPGCRARYGDWAPGTPGVFKPLAPLLILIGEKDDWTPAEACQELVERSRAAGYAVDIKVYPGALHSFDSNAPVRYVEGRVNQNSPTGRGATTGGDPVAWADSIEQVKRFLAMHLR